MESLAVGSHFCPLEVVTGKRALLAANAGDVFASDHSLRVFKLKRQGSALCVSEFLVAVSCALTPNCRNRYLQFPQRPAGFDSLCRPAAGEGPRSKRPLSPMLGCSCPTGDALLRQSWELTDLILSFEGTIQPVPVAANRGGTGVNALQSPTRRRLRVRPGWSGRK